MKENIKNIILNKPYPLSEEQKNAVISDAEYLRIVAGPGSGKSEAIIRRLMHLILCVKAPAETIELIAFTEKNAENLKSTIYKWMESYGGSSLIEEVKRLNIHTIDSLCKKIVQEYAGNGDFDVIIPERELALLIRHGINLGIDEKYSRFLDTVTLIENEMMDLDELKITNPVFMEQMENYYRFLKKHRLMSFAMLTRMAIEYLEQEDSIKPDIRYLMVDEYQDINPAQDKLIRLISRNADLSVVGDRFQTVYQWRGSDCSIFENFSKTYPSSVTIKLQNNYRSRKDIVDFINEVKSISIFSTDKSIDLHLKHTREGNTNIYSNVFATPIDEAQWTVDAIEKYKSEGGSYKDIAVLYRSVKGYAEPVISELRKRDIPYSIAGKMGLFIRNEVKAVAKLMVWLSANGFFYELGSKDRITQDKLLGSGLTDWQTIFPGSGLDPKVRSQLEDWKKRTLSGEYDSFKTVYEALLNILNFKQLDEADTEQRLIVINLGQFSALLDDVEYTIRLGGSKREWEDDLTVLCEYLDQAKYIYDSGSDDLPDMDAVTISTIHQAKGLDWKLTCLPCLNNGHLPSGWTGRSRKYMIDTSSFDIGRYAGKLKDEANLYYVAISRARDTLVLTYHQTKNYVDAAEISPFLEDSLQFNSVTRLNGKSSFPDFQIEPAVHSGKELKSYGLSDIVLYNKCPRLFWLRKKCGYSAKFDQMLGYGKALHFCLQNIAEKTRLGIDPDTIVDEIVEKDLYLPFSPCSANAREKAKDMLHNYINKNPDDMENICDTEVPITINFHDYLVDGKIDVIIIDDNGNKDVNVREYKTSDKVMSKEDVSLQIQAYALELTKDNNIIKGSVAFLETGEVHTVDVDKESLESARQKIDDCVNGMQNGGYTPKSTKFCEKCDMKDICKFAN
ncbi:MAG: ATP-dependent helicase UvrD/PcrA [Methanolobus sp.]|jgi:DNA helicase-2/ATP-dependent DNA helicase PcrA|nr:ATP-dependent helicase UvrD/PcrA [Methanolobus sp.]